MPLSRLQNLLRNPTGSILYVDPNNFDATDSFENRGDSATTPFKTIQRALIESARFSFRTGKNNDRYDRTTISVSSGVHYIDNRPGYSLKRIDNTAEVKTITAPNTWSVTTLNEFDENSNFDIFDENNDLYKYNSVEGGVILPRGTSIIGLDLRKTKIRPLYVPDPENDSIERSSIFKITGSCYFSSFSFFDADPSVVAYSDYANTKRVPTYSHHKLTAFTYADGVNKVRLGNEQINLTDLDMYYYKVSKAYASIPDYTLDISPVIDEYRIVGELKANALGILSISSVGNEITVTTGNSLTGISKPHQLSPDTPILISGIDSSPANDNAYNGSFTVKSIVGLTTFTYIANAIPESSVSADLTRATINVETDSVSSASPYIFSCSLRSVYGLCGLWADGSKADGFKSVVVAQFTGVSLQKDNNAFIIYNNKSYFNDTSLPADSVEKPLHTNSNAIYKPDYENFHIRTTNDAYMQCVSVFAIGYASHFLTESGADMDITNSNSNFGSCALVSSGFKSTSFDRDDCGYITHIIPPRELEYREDQINWVTLDVALTKASTNRLYLYGYKDAGVLPPNKTEGYRVGAKVGELLYLNILLDNTERISTSAPILMPTSSGNGVSAKKVYTVSRNNLGENSISSNKITFTSAHQLSAGEKVRVFSNTGQVPDGLETDVIYYASTSNTTSNEIYLASTYNDAIAGISIKNINNNGGILTIISSVTDKIPGDVGHPIQYDTDENNWYINSSSGISNGINTNLSSSTETQTAATTIARRPETRSVEDRLYKIRYVIPKEFIDAKAPDFGYILQESKSVEPGPLSPTSSGDLTNTIQLRNDKVISSATVGSISANTQVVTIQTPVPHKFIVGDIIKTEKIKSTNNPTAIGIVSTYNGTYEIASVPSSTQFTYVLKGANTNPGTFVTDTDLPVVSRVSYKNSFFVYRINTIKPLIPGNEGQDGVYLLTVLSSNVGIATSYGYNLYKKKFNQDVRRLYPQVDRDNYNSDPTASATFADLKTIGKVITNDKKNSITKEALNYFIKNTQLGFEITGVSLSGVGNTTITLTTNVEHELNSSNNVGDGLQLSGFLQNELNGVFKILDIPTTKSIRIYYPDGVSAYIPNTNSELPLALLSSDNITATSFSFTDINSGIATVTTSPAHGLFVGNKITIVGTGRTIYDSDFIVNSVLTLNTFTIKVEGAVSIPTSAPGTVLKHTLSANGKILGTERDDLASRASYIYGGIRKTLSVTSISLLSDEITLDSTSGLSRGDYVQINSEVLRLASNPSGNTFKVLRSQFGTITTTAAVGTIVTKIKVLPMELRRPSFMMASGHTFRYLGYGSGNYSTGVPQKQTRILTDDDILKSQAKKLSGGTVIYNGLNDRGDSFDGGKKQSSTTGQEIIVEAPIITFTGDDIDFDSASRTEGVFDTILVRDKITVEGGPTGTETSVFYGPVKVDNTIKVKKLEFTSDDGSGSASIQSPKGDTIYTNASVGIGTSNPLGKLHIRSAGITASAPSFGWPSYRAESDAVSRRITVDTEGNGNVATASSGATVSLVLGSYYDSRAVITPLSAGFLSPSDQGLGRGKDLLIKGGNSDNTALAFAEFGVIGGRLFLSGGSGYLGIGGTFDNVVGFNTNYGAVIIQPFNGNVGIGTTNPGEKLQVDGNLRVGISSTSNYIVFRGTTGDGVNASNDGDQNPGLIGRWQHTYIGERIYDGGERSELLLFKGNDNSDTAPVGPDRIRLVAAEFRFDTWTGNSEIVNGTFEQVATDTSTTNKMILTGSGSLGIGTTNPVSTLDVRGDTFISGNLNVAGAVTGYGTIPIGGIIMWSGASVPTGWALCNGGNGTPNLLDRFIIGAGGALGIGTTGGSANATLVSHTHTASTDSAGTHAHRLYVSQNSSGNTNRIDNNDVGVAGEGPVGIATYVLENNNEDGQQMIENAGSHSHTVTVDSAGSSATNANLPPYFALAFIMRVS